MNRRRGDDTLQYDGDSDSRQKRDNTSCTTPHTVPQTCLVQRSKSCIIGLADLCATLLTMCASIALFFLLFSYLSRITERPGRFRSIPLDELTAPFCDFFSRCVAELSVFFSSFTSTSNNSRSSSSSVLSAVTSALAVAGAVWLVQFALCYLPHLSINGGGCSPPPSIVDDSGVSRPHRNNSFAIGLLKILVFAVCVHYRWLSPECVHENWPHFLLCVILVACVIPYCLVQLWYFKSSHHHHRTQSLFSTVMHGNVINPYVFGINFKLFAFVRMSMMCAALLTFSYLSLHLDNHFTTRVTTKLNLPLIVYATCLLHYIFDNLFFEYELAVTPLVLRQPVNFPIVLTVAALPYILVLPLRAIYLNQSDCSLSYYCVLPLVATHLIGSCIFRLSNSQKNNFKRNPDDPVFAEFRTIAASYRTINSPARTHTKLLAGGWWAVSRHPNYLGDLIMCISWALCTGFSVSTTWIYALYFVPMIVMFCLQDEAHSAKKYGNAWIEYSKLVPYRIIPKIF